MTDLDAATKRLLILINASVEQALASNRIRPDLELYRRRIRPDVEETPTGARLSGWETEYFEKPDWYRAADAIFDLVKSTPEYRQFEAAIVGRVKTNDEATREAKAAVKSVIGARLNGAPYTAEQVCAILAADLSDSPLNTRCEIEVFGLDLFAQEIEIKLDGGLLRFRQMAKADFERETSRWEFEPETRSLLTSPTARLEIQIAARVPLDLQREAARTLVLLRLYRVGAIEFGKQNFSSQTLTHQFWGGTSSSIGLISHHPDRFTLKEADAGLLARYWTAMCQLLPKALRPYEDQPEESFLKIAYDRYCDSLFHKGQTQGAIAFAVMALEALLLGKEEKIDLKYRLAIRAGKILSKTGYAGPKTSDLVRAAYDIRSVYVHGGQLSKKDEEKFKKRLGLDLDACRTRVLNYVRVTILICIFSKLGKDEMLKILDASLLDTVSDQSLETQLAGYNALGFADAGGE